MTLRRAAFGLATLAAATALVLGMAGAGRAQPGDPSFPD
jgi:hypothetical protein